MKRLLLALIPSLALALSVSAGEEEVGARADGVAIREGVSKRAVLKVLGDPRGYIGSESHQILYFDRGEVVLRDGRVVSHSIVSEEEAQKRQERTERRREELRRKREEQRERRREEGLAIKEERLADPRFHQLPAAARLAFWENFQQRYPEVDVGLHLAVTREEVREEERERRARHEYDRRLAEFEARAAEAEERARRAESRARHYYYPYVRRSPVTVYRTQPVIRFHPRMPQSPVDAHKRKKVVRRIERHHRDVSRSESRRSIERW